MKPFHIHILKKLKNIVLVSLSAAGALLRLNAQNNIDQPILRIELLTSSTVLPFHTATFELSAKVHAFQPERFSVRFFSGVTPITRRAPVGTDSIARAVWCITTLQRQEKHQIYAVLTDNFYTGYSDTIYVSFQQPELPVGWQYLITSTFGLVSIPLESNPTFDGEPLEEGDLIGVFYDSMEIRRVAGFGAWQRNGIVIRVFGAEAQKNGLERREKFRFWLWKKQKMCFTDQIEVAFWEPHHEYFTPNQTSVVRSFRAYSIPFSFDIHQACAQESKVIKPIIKRGITCSFEAFEKLHIDEKTGMINVEKSQEGVHVVRIHSLGCLSKTSDTIQIRSLPKLHIEDTLYSCGDSLILNAKFHPQWKYLWESGSQTNQSVVYQSGYHRAVIIDEAGCVGRDSVYVVVRQMNPKRIDIEMSPTSCADSSATIWVNLLGKPMKYVDFVLYSFQGDSIASSHKQFAKIKPGSYWLYMRYKDECFIKYPEEIKVSEPLGCVHHILAPSLNQQASVVPFPYQGKVQIFDKNGFLVKELITPSFWDGTNHQNLPVEMGVYIAISSQGEQMQITVLR
ncbi:MAG: hypothetical protein NZM38_06730 [Cytophagales bacterium]|nr:hypothetical protein [Cytophagales bacterium]MDW8384451.1 hypothetical protein [Flammeovirgaceae bacterium]